MNTIDDLKNIRETLKVSAETKNLTQVLAFVDALLERAGCPLKMQMRTDVAVEELYIDIANYAYLPGKGEAVINVWFEDDSTIVIEFRDKGKFFDPLMKEDPDVTLSAGERPIGGLGIFMVKKSMDDVQYRREGDQNILTIKKKL